MNVVKGEKKDWRKGDELYTNWEPRLWKHYFRGRLPQQLQTPLSIHNSHSSDCPVSYQSRVSIICDVGSIQLVVYFLWLSRRSDRHRLRSSACAGCQPTLAEQRLDLFFRIVINQSFVGVLCLHVAGTRKRGGMGGLHVG
jgi:hypothetical protein